MEVIGLLCKNLNFSGESAISPELLLLITDNSNAIKTLNELVINSKELVETTYKDLKALRDNNKLINGQFYRITDYITTTSLENTRSAGHAFDVIVLATSSNNLSHKSYAIQHANDTYFNNNLSAWQILYDLDNNPNKYKWADTNGTGVIYYMKDEFDNECWYDFKNIQFLRNNEWLSTNSLFLEMFPELNLEDQYFYTFTRINSNLIFDATIIYPNLFTKYSHSNSILKYINSKIHTLNNTILITNNEYEPHSNVIGINNCDNTFAINNSHITNNTIEGNYLNNLVLGNFSNNVIGKSFLNNSIKGQFVFNHTGTKCTSLTINLNFNYNNLKDNLWNLIFDYPVSYCEFGSYMLYNYFHNGDDYPSSESSLSYCKFGDGLTGALLIPSMHNVEFETKCYYNDNENFHFNTLADTEGNLIIEKLIVPHELRLYVYRAEGTLVNDAISPAIFGVDKKSDVNTIQNNINQVNTDIEEVYNKVLIVEDLIDPEEVSESVLVDGDITQTMGTDNKKIMSLKAVSEILLPLQQMLLDEEFLQENYAYGIEFDTTISTPTCTRIGNMNYHKSLPVHSLIKGCLLDDDGNVVEYLPKDDWTNSTRDGSKGQVMVEIPEHYRKFVTSDTKRQVWLSTIPLLGYHRVPKCYVSAYQATVQRSTLKLSSVVNTSPDYRGGNNTNWDDTYRTLCGMPATSINRTNFRTYARNRKTTTAEWNCMTYDMLKTLYWLFVTEYATLNTLATYNSALTTEGFKQGGLDAGVTNLNYNLWTTYNSNNPVIPCGYTDSLGNNTGVVTFTMPEEYNTTLLNMSVPRYRGIENPFGHIWQWTDGINIRNSPTEENGGDGLSKVFICNDPSKFNDSSYTGYTYVGDETRTEGYVKELIFGEYGEIMPKVVGGSSSTYFCDYHYTNILSTETLRGVLFGGSADNGANAGLAYVRSSYAPSNASASVGSRLCFYFLDNV